MASQDLDIKYYSKIIADDEKKYLGPTRYVPLSSRRHESVFSTDTWLAVQKGKLHIKFSGIPCLKDPFCFPLYSMLIEELKPKTILENGTLQGGSALWLANLCKVLKVKTHVYSLDFAPELRNIKSDHPDVTYLVGDLNYPSTAWPESLLSSFHHPILFIEDAHTNLINVVKHLEKFFIPGDYVIIEDTLKVDEIHQGEDPWEKYKDLPKLFDNDKYMVDSKYCDFFGYNSTYNWNSFFRVMK